MQNTLPVICVSLFLLLLAASGPVRADNVKSLSHLQQQLAAKQAAQIQLANQVKNAGTQLAASQTNLVALGAAAQQAEQDVQDLDTKAADAGRERDARTAELHDSTAAMGNLVLILTRLRRTPPELLLLRPGATLQTAESAQVLGAVLPALRQRAAAVDQELQKLQVAQQDLDVARQKAAAKRAALQGDYKNIAVQAAQRATAYKQLTGNLTETQSEVAQISQKAQSLQELIDQLAKARASRAMKKAAAPLPQTAESYDAYTWSIPRPGRPQLPVAGRILTGFSERDRIGATSQGLTLQTAPGALALAPMGGVVRYAGPFRAYGQLVLLEHEGGYMSLIAGLSTIDATLGQSLAAGEPLGRLPGEKIAAGKNTTASSRAAAPALYYELRYHGQPVDPAVKFPDLRAKS